MITILALSSVLLQLNILCCCLPSQISPMYVLRPAIYKMLPGATTIESHLIGKRIIMEEAFQEIFECIMKNAADKYLPMRMSSNF
jgi:hypothetical protein